MPETLYAKTLLERHVARTDCILLVNPPVEEVRYAWLRWNQPLDLLKLAAWLRKHVGCEVCLLDFMKPTRAGKVSQRRLPGDRQNRFVGDTRYPMRYYGQPHGALAEWISARKKSRKTLPTQVWITSLCSYWLQSLAQVCAKVKQALPDVPVVLLGNSARLVPDLVSERCPVDYLVSRTFEIDEPTSLDLYGEEMPPFLALRLKPKTAITEIRDAVGKQVFRFAFFEDDVCRHNGEPLSEIVSKAKGLHRHVRFHVICGLYPEKLSPELAATLADPCFAEIRFEETDEGDQLNVEAYRRAVSYLREAGATIPDKKVGGFCWLGRPEENLEDVVLRSFQVLDVVGSFILKPFTPTPKGNEHRRHRPYLSEIPHQDWSPHVFPFAELNGISRRDYNDLHRMAAFLNERVSDRAFDFLKGTLGAEFLRSSLDREVWNIGPSPFRVVD